MVGLSKPLSVRLADEDAVFLAGLELDGATTASDKVRALIKLARQRAESPESYPAALAMSHDLLSAPRRAVWAAEGKAETRSDVVAGLLTALEDVLAAAVSGPGEADGQARADLARFEARLVDRAARLTELLLRWAVTAEAPAYDPKVVGERLKPLRELMKLVTAESSAREES